MFGMAVSGDISAQAASVWRSVSDEVADIVDNTPWESAWPLLLIAGLLFLAVCSLALSAAGSDEDEADYWRGMALTGRGLFSGAAAVVAVGWIAGRASGLI